MKILQIFGEPIANGGEESFVMNMYECIDKKRLQFDLFTPYYCENVNTKKKIESYGGKVIVRNKRFNSKLRKLYFMRELKKFLDTNKYDVVHINSGSTIMLASGARIAKKSGVKKVIVHSHCASKINMKTKILKKFCEILFIYNTDEYLACSSIAAECKFPKSICEQKEYKVIKNGIQLKKFQYSEETRNEYRKLLKCEKSFVMGNVGRMGVEKNQMFLLDILEEILKTEIDAKLIIVGNGELKERINEKIKEKGLENNVILLSDRSDVNKILQAMDIFVFPSLYEGLGIAAIESQAAGLHTICSENIPDEAKVTDLLEKIELNKGAVDWAKEILKYKEAKRNINEIALIEKKGYNAIESAKILEKIYEN